MDVTHTDNLEVHHRTYERLGEELASDLTVLCNRCHHVHHQHSGASTQLIIAAVLALAFVLLLALQFAR